MSNLPNHSISDVSALYDQLLEAEKKVKPDNLYAIHKILNFDSDQVKDVYQWIMMNLTLPNSGNILDAGCGVGWGTQYIAERTNSQVTGISISPAEIKHAKKNTKAKNLNFLESSFDEIKPSTFDAIIAIESVKHSPDINLSVEKLINGLRPDGKLVIVDDFYTADTFDHCVQQLKKDWCLNDIISSQHIPKPDKSLLIDKYDLTKFMKNQYVILGKLKHRLLNILLALNPNNKGWQAFRGGFLLEKLYNQKKMRYQAFVITKI